MKIIFLDIDGVLNSQRSFKINRNTGEQIYDHPFPYHVKKLNTILEKSGAKIVLSSAWRSMGRYAVNQIFKECGIIEQIFSMTPRMWVKRGIEIQTWIDSHDELNIESFCIIDDDSDMEHLMPFLVKTKNETGLCEEHIKKALLLLNVTD
jgi:hypothetical protein